MKSVLLLSARSDQGGGPKHLLELARFLKKRGHRVFVASPTAPPYGPSFAREFAGHVELPHRRFSPLAWLRLAHLVRTERIQIVHSHGKGAGVYARLLKVFGPLIIHTFHGLHLKTIIDRAVESVLSVLTDKFICVSSSEVSKAQALGMPRDKIFLRPNGMDFNRFSSSSAAPFTLGTLSRLDPHKGNLRLVRLMTQLPEEFSLRIAGSGEERARLLLEIDQLGLNQRVFLVGEVSDPVNFLREISIFVSASLGEGLPYAILEAIAAEKPIVASDVPGHRELLPSDCLFQEDFVEKIMRAHHQDVAMLRQTLAAKLELKACLSAIEELY